MGPLVGDNVVRVIPGGAIAIASDIHKKPIKWNFSELMMVLQFCKQFLFSDLIKFEVDEKTENETSEEFKSENCQYSTKIE